MDANKATGEQAKCENCGVAVGYAEQHRRQLRRDGAGEWFCKQSTTATQDPMDCNGSAPCGVCLQPHSAHHVEGFKHGELYHTTDDFRVFGGTDRCTPETRDATIEQLRRDLDARNEDVAKLLKENKQYEDERDTALGEVEAFKKERKRYDYAIAMHEGEIAQLKEELAGVPGTRHALNESLSGLLEDNKLLGDERAEMHALLDKEKVPRAYEMTPPPEARNSPIDRVRVLIATARDKDAEIERLKAHVAQQEARASIATVDRDSYKRGCDELAAQLTTAKAERDKAHAGMKKAIAVNGDSFESAKKFTDGTVDRLEQDLATARAELAALRQPAPSSQSRPSSGENLDERLAPGGVLIDEIEQLLAKATPRPWHHHTATLSTGGYAAVGPVHKVDQKDGYKDMNRAEDDAALIHALVNHAPALCSTARRLQRELSEQRDDLIYCGIGVKADEDGCCAHCGHDAIPVVDGVPSYGAAAASNTASESDAERYGEQLDQERTAKETHKRASEQRWRQYLAASNERDAANEREHKIRDFLIACQTDAKEATAQYRRNGSVNLAYRLLRNIVDYALAPSPAPADDVAKVSGDRPIVNPRLSEGDSVRVTVQTAPADEQTRCECGCTAEVHLDGEGACGAHDHCRAFKAKAPPAKAHPAPEPAHARSKRLNGDVVDPEAPEPVACKDCGQPATRLLIYMNSEAPFCNRCARKGNRDVYSIGERPIIPAPPPAPPSTADAATGRRCDLCDKPGATVEVVKGGWALWHHEDCREPVVSDEFAAISFARLKDKIGVLDELRAELSNVRAERDAAVEEAREALKRGANMRQRLLDRMVFGGMVSGGDMPSLDEQAGDWQDAQAFALRIIAALAPRPAVKP